MSLEEATAIHTPRSTKVTGLHSRIGVVTSYQVYPSEVTGPRVMATIVPASSLPSRPAEVSGPVRYERPSSVTRPNPPLARAGAPSQVEDTFQLPVLPLLSRARTRNA